MSGSLMLEVGDADVSAVLVMRQGVSVTGRALRMVGSTSVPVANAVISLHRDLLAQTVPPAATPNVFSSADGTFVISGAGPGRYWVTASLEDPQTVWFLESSRLGELDTRDWPFEVGPERPVSGLVLTLTDRAASIQGRVHDSAGAPWSNCFVVVIPADERLWSRMLPRLPGPIRPRVDGTFQLDGLTGGDYIVAALDDVNPVRWYDDSRLKLCRQIGVRLKLLTGEVRSVSVPFWTSK
jgi:hypothetical protein